MINLASYARALMPGVNAWYGMGYNEYPEVWSQIFKTYNSDKNFEEDVNTYGMGLAQVKSEMGSIQYQDMAQGGIKRYQHVTYGLGFIVSREQVEDNQYEQLAEQRSKALGMSARQTKENVAANILNRAFDSNYLQPDGVVLCSTAHKLSKGGTYANRLTNGADLSEASIEDSLIQIRRFTNDAGLRISVQGQKLIIPIESQFEAKRILGNDYRPGTADRDINAMVSMGMLPGGYVINPYLTDSDAWFILTDVPDGMKHFERRAIEISNDTADFDTENMKFKLTYRDSFGVTDMRAIFGSPGA